MALTIHWIVPPLLINTAQRIWNVTNDNTVDSTYCDNILIFGIIQNSLLQDNSSPNTGVHIVLYTCMVTSDTAFDFYFHTVHVSLK